MACQACRGHRVLLTEERLRLADATQGIPTLAEGVLPLLLEVASGRLRQAHDRLREALREAEGREADPSAAVIDSQAVKGAGGVGGPERGYDGAKRLSGRKRHLLVDTGG